MHCQRVLFQGMSISLQTSARTSRLLLSFSYTRFIARSEGKSLAHERGANNSEQLSHWNIEGRRKFGCKSQRGALDGARAGGCAAWQRGTMRRTAPQCTASASALQPCSIRCSGARACTTCVYTESCKCDAYAMLVWPMTSSALPMTFTATTPCPCSSSVHPGQASTSLITKDSVNDPANYIFRAG